MATPRVGAEISGYRLESVIARGGMSSVFLATHLGLARRVAIKFLAADLSEDDMFRERFVRESRIAAALDHPNVIPIYEAGESDGSLFIAMRYVQGPNLKALVEQVGPLALARALPIISQAAGALDAAHAGGLVHRDVKPGNILIDLAIGPEQGDHVYLCDFGLTKRSGSRSGLTQTGQFVGTIDYIAPEQIEGKEIDFRTDVYSLGCVIYETLTATVPFGKPTEAAVLWAHVQEDPPPITKQRPDLPASIDRVIFTAMAKQPDDRYQTCTDLVNDLRDVLAEASASPTPSPAHSGEVAHRPTPDYTVLADAPPSGKTGNQIEHRAVELTRVSDSEAGDSIGGSQAPEEGQAPSGSIPPSKTLDFVASKPARRHLETAAIAIAAAAVLLLVGGTVGWAIGKGSDTAGTPSSGSEIYRRILLDHVPDTYRSRCHQGPNQPPANVGVMHLTPDGVFAVADCAPSAGLHADMYLVHSTEGMIAAFYDILDDQDVQPSEAVYKRLQTQLANATYTPPDLTASSQGLLCGDGSTATLNNRVANLWARMNDTGHQELSMLAPGMTTSDDTGMSGATGSGGTAGVAGGLVACFLNGSTGDYTIVWTDNQTTIFGIATSAQQPSQLYNFWVNDAGPLEEAPGMGM